MPNFSLTFFCVNSCLSPSGVIKNNMILGEGYSPMNSNASNHWAFDGTSAGVNSEHSAPTYAIPRHYTLDDGVKLYHSVTEPYPANTSNVGHVRWGGLSGNDYSEIGWYNDEVIWADANTGYIPIIDNTLRIPWSTIRVDATPNTTGNYLSAGSHGNQDDDDTTAVFGNKTLRIPHFYNGSSAGDNYTTNYDNNRGNIIARALGGQKWLTRAYAYTHNDAGSNRSSIWIFGTDSLGDFNPGGESYGSTETYHAAVHYLYSDDRWYYVENRITFKDDFGGQNRIAGITVRYDNDQTTTSTDKSYHQLVDSWGLMRTDISLAEMASYHYVDGEGFDVGDLPRNMSLTQITKGMHEHVDDGPIFHIDSRDFYCQRRDGARNSVTLEPFCRSTANWHEDIDIGDNLAEGNAGTDNEEVLVVGANGQPNTGTHTADDSNWPDFYNKWGGVWKFNGTGGGAGNQKGMNMQFDMGNLPAITWCMWIHPDLAIHQYLADGRNDNGSWWIMNYQGYNLDIHEALRYRFYDGHSGYGNGSLNAYYHYIPDRWVYIVITSSSGGSHLYIQGDDVTNRCNVHNSLNENMGKNYRIGCRYNETWSLAAKVCMHTVYDAELTHAEVLQNYNATKWRFGSNALYKRPYAQTVTVYVNYSGSHLPSQTVYLMDMAGNVIDSAAGGNSTTLSGTITFTWHHHWWQGGSNSNPPSADFYIKQKHDDTEPMSNNTTRTGDLQNSKIYNSTYHSNLYIHANAENPEINVTLKFFDDD